MSTPNDKIQHVSASQFKTFSRCKRKWFIEKCTDAPRPEPSKAMVLGTAVHAVLEEYLRDGVVPDEETRAGRIAASGLHLLPEGVLEIETEIKLQDIEPPLVGFIDVLDLTEPWCPTVIDHKTTSSWDWAKTEEELRCDPQMISYARYALDECAAADAVEVCHIQYKTKGAPEARRVSALLDREHVDEQWEKLRQLATEIKATSLFDEVEEVEPNLSACGDFGGCPYADTCAAFGDSPSPFAGIETIETEKEDEMTRLEELLQRRKAKKAPPILSQDAAPRTEEEPVPGERQGPIEKKAADNTLTFVEPVPARDKYSDEQYSEAASALLAFMRGRDVRSMGNVSARPIVGKVLIHNGKPLGRVRPYYVEKACHMSEGTLTYDKGTVVRGSATSGLALEAGIVRGSWEPTPGKMSPPAMTQAELNAELGSKAAPKPEVKPKEEKPKERKAAPSLVVYIDCLPTKGAPEGTQSFEDVIAPHVDAVAKKNNVSTPLLMAYGEGKNHVAGLLRVKPPTGCVTVTSDNPYWPACKTVLLQAADIVVTGIK